MTLTCNPGHSLDNVSISWSVECKDQTTGTCTFKPQPPQDDDRVITCTIVYSNGQRVVGLDQLDLRYPPTSQPTIEDNSNGKVLQDGDILGMSCTVRGGKPLVKSIDFFCTGHPDQNDIAGNMYKQSLLHFNPVRVSDDGIDCVCSAVWEDTKWYTLGVNRKLSVNGTGARLESQNSTYRLVVGVSSAASIVVLAGLMFLARIAWMQRWKFTYDRPKHGRNQELSPHNTYSHYVMGNSDQEDYAEIADMSASLQTSQELAPSDIGFLPSSNLPTKPPTPCRSAKDASKANSKHTHPDGVSRDDTALVDQSEQKVLDDVSDENYSDPYSQAKFISVNGDDLKVAQDNPESVLNLTSPETQREGSVQSRDAWNDQNTESQQKGDHLQPQKRDYLLPQKGDYLHPSTTLQDDQCYDHESRDTITFENEN